MKCDKHRTFLPIDESQLEIAPVVAHGWIVSVSGCKARINLFDLGHVVTPHWSLVDVAFWVGKTQRKPSAITAAVTGRRRGGMLKSNDSDAAPVHGMVRQGRWCCRET